jgi:Transposase DDE domain group 1
MENRIKGASSTFYADRTSAATMPANQLRLWLVSLAYLLVDAVRRLGLAGTEMANATAGSIRLKLLKIGAVVTVSVRRIKLAFASAWPTKAVFTHALQRLRELRAPPEAAVAA